MSQGDDPHAVTGDTEEVDALPVPDGEHGLTTGLDQVAMGLEPAQPARRTLAHSLPSLRSGPAIQAAAVAAGGFVAGAAVVGLARRRQTAGDRLLRSGRDGRGRGRGLRRRDGGGELLRIVGSRSLLLDVHLLDSSGRGR